MGAPTPPSAAPVHSTSKLTPQHVRPNRPVSCPTSQSPLPTAATANGMASSPRVVPSPASHAAAVGNTAPSNSPRPPPQPIPQPLQGHPQTQLQNQVQQRPFQMALRCLLKWLKWLTTRHCKLVMPMNCTAAGTRTTDVLRRAILTSSSGSGSYSGPSLCARKDSQRNRALTPRWQTRWHKPISSNRNNRMGKYIPCRVRQ